MRHFLFEDKEYRYRANFRRARQVRDPVVELARLFRRKGFAKPRPRPKDLRQKCTAKMNYSNSLEAHRFQLKEYLIREGAGLDGSTPELFGSDGEEYRQNMVPKNYRIFLSPATNDYDLKDLGEQFIKKLEKQTGYRLYWQGACHYNTAHHHTHLLINGVDKQGREVQIPRDVVKTFMRETARDLCTAQVGSRTWEDLEREKEQALTSPRHTKLDDRIGELSDNSRVIVGKHTYDRERLLARLEALRKLKLCSYENGGYVLKKDWQEDLRNNGRYNIFLKAREGLKYTDPSLMKVYTGEHGLVTGKVTKIYRTDDDASDNHAVVLEGLDGKAYFVPLLNKPEVHDGKEKSPLKEGELVTVKAYQSQRGRLTPTFFRKEIRSAQKEIRQNNYSGALADEIRKTRGGIWNAFGNNQRP
jgi:hypothetical protein